MSDRTAWGQDIDKGEAGTMRAAEIEQRDAMRRQQEEQDRQAREHQRRMEAEQERQRQRDRQIQSRRGAKPVSPSREKQVARSTTTSTSIRTSSIGKLSVFLAVAGGVYASSQPQLQADAFAIALVILVASFIGAHLVYYGLKTVFFLLKWAMVGIGIVFIFYVLVAFFEHA